MKRKKKNVAVYIDAENISARKLDVINTICEREGKLISINVYRRKNDKYTKEWRNVSNKRKTMNEIMICGKPRKDKVDKKIIMDMGKDLSNNTDIDTVILFSSDHGYAEIVKEIAKNGKEVIVAGKNLSERLKTAAGVYYEID